MESEVESEPETYYNNGYDEGNGKPPPLKKKIKWNRGSLSEEESNNETGEEEEEDECESKNDNEKSKKQIKQNKPPPNKKNKHVK